MMGYTKPFTGVSKFVGRFLESTCPDLYEAKKNALGDLDKEENAAAASAHSKTNAFLRLLNQNIINLNCSTSLYSRVMVIFTAVLIFLTIIIIVLTIVLVILTKIIVV